jgi:NAD(P)-dependent dehydrogenase (short-subunit alcohol dehydrogenase family)
MVGRASYDYTDRTAIVTGSTKGIGRGIAERLVDAGANVVVNSRTESAVEETAAELTERGPGEATGVAGDMSDPGSIEALFEAALEAYGAVDLLVNNAATWPPGPMHEQGLEEWDHGLAVNARGPYYLSLLVARDLIDRDREGCIVNVTSQAGERHGHGHGLYGVSKAAQNGLTWRLAFDLAPHGIRVNAVSTSQTDSYQLRKAVLDGDPDEHTEEEAAAAMAELAEDIPLGRVGQPEDIGDGVCFLASDAASYVTGHVLRVSGGNNLK